jgi:hypothetical protein
VVSDPSPPALVLRADPFRATRQVPVAAPFAAAATVAAWVWPALGQPSAPHHPNLLVQVVTSTSSPRRPR